MRYIQKSVSKKKKNGIEVLGLISLTVCLSSSPLSILWRSFPQKGLSGISSTSLSLKGLVVFFPLSVTRNLSGRRNAMEVAENLVTLLMLQLLFSCKKELNCGHYVRLDMVSHPIPSFAMKM